MVDDDPPAPAPADERAGDSRVVRLTASQTHDIRTRVLRAGTPTDDVVWYGDDHDSTVHLGIVVGASTQPIAISTWLRSSSPDVESPGRPTIGVQLRGMATDPSHRGQGQGSTLLRAGLGRAQRDGADHVWANARSAVLDFYLAHGFEVTSDEFLTTATAIPHRRILRHRHVS